MGWRQGWKGRKRALIQQSGSVTPSCCSLKGQAFTMLALLQTEEISVAIKTGMQTDRRTRAAEKPRCAISTKSPWPLSLLLCAPRNSEYEPSLSCRTFSQPLCTSTPTLDSTSGMFADPPQGQGECFTTKKCPSNVFTPLLRDLREA